MEKKHSFLIKVAILVAGYGMWSDQIVVSIASKIFASFPNTPLAVQNFVLSGPALFTVPLSLLAAFLTRHISKRNLLIICTTAFTISGVAIAFCNNLYAIAALRVIDGMTDGLNSIICTSLICELYEGKERAKMLGFYVGVSGLFGMLFAFFSGIIAEYNWRFAFLLNGVTIIAVICTIIAIPETPLEVKLNSKQADGTRFKIPKDVWLVYFSVLVFDILYYAIYYCIDLYIAERGLGTTALSGTITAVTTALSVVISFAFGVIYNKLQHWIPIICAMGGIATYLILGMNSNAFMVMIANCIGMAAWSLFYPYYQEYIAQLVPKDRISLPIALSGAAAALSRFFAPYVPTIIMEIKPGITYHKSMYGIAFLFAIYTVFVIVVVFKRIRKA